MAKTITKTTDEDEDQSTGTETESDEEDEGQGAGTETESDEEEDDDSAILATLNDAQAALFKRIDQERSAASKQARERRLALKALRSGAPAGGSPKPGPKAPAKTEGKTTDFDPEAFKAALLAEMQGGQEAARVQTAAEKALRRAGLLLPDDEDAADRKLAKVLKMLDLGNTALDEVADEVAELKADSPELFGRRKTTRPRTGGVGGPATIKGGPKGTDVDSLFD